MKFTAKAPGKIIIVGEHFVVHGSYSLAAAIKKGTLVHASVSDRSILFSKDFNLTAELPNKIPFRLTPLVETLKSTLTYLGERRGVKLEISSDIPISAGLGSSAAGSVALVAAASAALNHPLKKEEIIELAMTSEKIIHGNPSGIDPVVATYGGILLYKKGLPPKLVKSEVSTDFIISYTGSGHSTSKMIKKFSKSKKTFPAFFRSLVNSSSILAETAATAIACGDLPTLAAIINFTHSVLSSFGVSSIALDRAVDTALRAGCIGAKLTGGGGGGCIIALPKTGKSDNIFEKIRNSAADAWLVNIPHRGVRVWRSKE